MPKLGRKYPPELTRQKMIDWCNKAERTQWDVRKKLIDWNIPSLERENVIADLISSDLLNERRYASAFVHDKSTFNKWGLGKIKMHLKAKGISERNILDALREVDHNIIAQSVNALIRKKLPSLKGLKTWQKKIKLIQFLSGKGFSREDCEHLIDALLGEKE